MLKSYHHHPAGLRTPPPESFCPYCITHCPICASQATVSPSQARALMSVSIRAWHCVIQTCSDECELSLKGWGQAESSFSCRFFPCCPSRTNWICRTGNRSLLSVSVYWSVLLSFGLVIPAETWLQETFLEPLIHLQELFSTTTVPRPRWALCVCTCSMVWLCYEV